VTKPPAVEDVTEFWTEPPPASSVRLEWWKNRIAGGWRPNRRIGSMGYHTSAEWYGIYIWEYTKVLSPLLMRLMGTEPKEPKLLRRAVGFPSPGTRPRPPMTRRLGLWYYRAPHGEPWRGPFATWLDCATAALLEPGRREAIAPGATRKLAHGR
jgi:hypothetical protein